MNRTMSFAAVGLLALSFATGCATKRYVRNETAPTINKVNELDELMAKNTNSIKEVDSRAQQGLQGVNQKADAADQKALAAGQAADQAQQAATSAQNGATSLANTAANLDNYHPIVDASVHFGMDKSSLTSKAKDALDQLGAEMQNAKNFILVVDGNTDSGGDANYNYQLSQRRADTVIRYLASKYSVPAYKIHVIGLGKDKPVEPNKTSAGRAMNRRVDVHLMTNSVNQGPASAQATQPSSAPPQQ
jgi:OmpA-OmpF porin, OOP family